jgi:hypothetical protein
LTLVASRIKAIHRALIAEELAELLQVARLTILRRAKPGQHSVVPCLVPVSDSIRLQSPSG